MFRFGDEKGQLKCSFCGKSQEQVRKLIAGPGVYICDECIELCNEIIEEELYKNVDENLRLRNIPKPKEINHILNQYVIGQDYWKDIRKAATAAIHRAWADYHDILGAMATALKSGRDPLFAKTMWDDTINQVGIMIRQMGGKDGPTEKEVNEGFIEVRRARGIQGRNGMVLIDSNKLQKVGFEKGK